MFRTKKIWLMVSMLAVLSMVVSACAPAATTAPTSRRRTPRRRENPEGRP